MASKSVCILSSSGRKLGYKTYKLAMTDVEAGIALKESERCIRLLPSSEGVEWRSRRSGRYGPVVMQMDRLLTKEEEIACIEQHPKET
jgi:hypothetical protein